MRILLIATDEFTEFFDKRILDIALVLGNLGHKVIIVTIGPRPKIVSEENYVLIQNDVLHGFESKFIDQLKITSESINSLTAVNETGIVRLLRLLARKLLPENVLSLLRAILLFQKNLRKQFLTTLYVARKDFYEVQASKQIALLEDNNADLLIGCDLPGSIAAMGIKKSNQFFWYDAHEYYSLQGWLRGKVSMERLKIWENEIVMSADLLTTVSWGLKDLYALNFAKSDTVKVLTNASDPQRLNLKGGINLRNVLEIDSRSKICVFHGGLSGEHRNLEQFAESFLSLKMSSWHLLYLGYNASSGLIKLQEKSPYFHVRPPYSNSELGHVLLQCDAIAMPYVASDLNTVNGFPNKLGDAITLRIPFIYNVELKEIHKHATEFDIGTAFNYSDKSQLASSILNSIEALQGLRPDWESASKKIGWAHFQNTCNEIMKHFEEKSLLQRKTT